MVYILKDSFDKEYAIYQNFEKKVPVSKHERFRMKNMKPTDNLMLNMEIASLKNAPIQNSVRKHHQIDTRPLLKFKGETVLPHYKQNLRSWSVA